MLLASSSLSKPCNPAVTLPIMLSVKNTDPKPYGVSARWVTYLALIPIALAFLPLLVPESRLCSIVGTSLAMTGVAVGWHIVTGSCMTCESMRECKDQDTQDGVESSDPHRAQVIAATEIMAALGPSQDLAETKRTMVGAGCAGLETDLVALFTIDPCIGSIECECTEGVSEGMRQSFLSLFDQRLTDRARKHAWLVRSAADLDTADEAARQTILDCGVQEILACPIRSEASACGVLVAFYREEQTHVEDRIHTIEVLSAQASTALSYALSLEQSRFLLDDLAGVNQELSFQATVDGLTNLPNHRTFQQTLTDMCRRTSGKKGRLFCVVMVDVDHFKIYNDTYGHRQGDAVLRKVAKTMSAGLRQGDMAARYGGEEFAMIFQGATKDAAFAAAERVRRAIAEQSFRKGVVTVSMGVAEFPLDAASAGELIELADKALYHAKVTGRNRVFAWGTMGARTGNDPSEKEDVRERTVLFVERAQEATTDVLVDTLSAHSCSVEVVNTATEAAELLRTRVFDIALVSREALPGLDAKALSTLAAIHPHMPIVLLTPDLPPHETKEALRRGATDILLKPYNPAELPVVVERNLERQRLELQRLMQKSTGVMLQAIEALVAAIDAKDEHTAGHSRRVAAMSMSLSDDLKISNEERFALELAAKLHDIGKVALPDSALNKQSPLTEEEWQAMREHPALGAKIVGAISELAYVSTIIRHHHERLDGTGYPDGLSGPAIPYMSRIISVADAYEAMTSERAHRSRLTPGEAIKELRRHAGTYYEPEVVEVLGKQLAARGDAAPSDEARAA